jgi:predicted metal-dependent enzyme (double-stranded beta helix superfamily)
MAAEQRTQAPRGGRWHVRLSVGDRHDIWLIGWGRDSQIELHDHGTSAGALAVVHGGLVEQRLHRDELVQHVLLAGEATAFVAGERHGIANRGSDSALSVHVYSPALSSMTYFDNEGTPLTTDLVDLPGILVN